MMYYRLRRDQFHDEDTGRYIAFGIDVFEEDTLIRSVKDISLSERKLSKLISLFNTLQPDPVHIDDIIEDFLD